MVDRQDIDALLIGSLYGELSSTEEARLAAHLESHPADRTALANLTHAREVVRESRMLQIQFDPPASITAFLIQEAARRAPKAREEMSWFQRFMRSFLMHPAMAAAAMLVLVVGIAGTMYLRNGDQFAKQTKEDPKKSAAHGQGADMPPAVEPAPAPPTATGDQPAFYASDAGVAVADNYRVQLEDKEKNEAQKTGEAARDRQSRNGDDISAKAKLDEVAATRNALEKKREEQLAMETNAKRQMANQELAKESQEGIVAKKSPPKDPPKAEQPTKPEKLGTVAKNEPPKAKPPATKSSKGYIEVTTPDSTPKDFDSKVASGRGDTAKPTEPKPEPKKPETTTKIAGGSSGGAGAPGAANGPAGPRAPSTPTTDPRPTTPPPPPPAVAVEQEKKQENKPDPLLAWAKEQHGKAIVAAKKDCKLAASIAMQIANRAPAYYAANIEKDRALKGCEAYIAQEREREQERVNRAKATQRRSVDEAPAPRPAETSK